MRDVILYGAGLLGRQVHYLVETYCSDKYNVVGFIDDTKEAGEIVCGSLTILASLDDIYSKGDYPPDRFKMIMAIGYANMAARGSAFHRAKGFGYEFASIVHPEAFVEKNASVGEGVLVLAGVIVDQFTKVGDLNYLDIGVKVGENTVIEENNYFAAGTTLAGSVKVGSNNFFGLDTTVVNDISIGDGNTINAKSLIYKNLDDNKRVVTVHKQRYIES